MKEVIKLGIIALLLFFMSITCHAQNLKVESFVEASNVELVPDRDTVNDGNGDLCALIKVQIVDKNVSFEGGVSRSYKKGQNEWWVWISTKAKRLTIKSDSFLPLTVIFGDYGFEHLIDARKQTYLLRLVQPSIESPKDRLARITVYDKDNKELVGAEVMEKTTGKVYGSTRYDGTVAVGFERKGETTEVIVSHPSYSDTVELTVQSGVHDYIVSLHNINTKPSPESPRKQKYNHNNTLAFFESAILPGLGQWRKGYAGWGLANMLGEAGLVSGAVYYYNSAQKISNQGLIDTEMVAVYNRNITAYNVFFGAAIALYAFNLLQAVIIKPQEEYNIAVAPSIFPVGNTLTPSISLTFNF